MRRQPRVKVSSGGERIRRLVWNHEHTKHRKAGPLGEPGCQLVKRMLRSNFSGLYRTRFLGHTFVLCRLA